MFEVKKQRRLGRGATHLAVGSALLSAVLLAGCSSVSDAIEWMANSPDPSGVTQTATSTRASTTASTAAPTAPSIPAPTAAPTAAAAARPTAVPAAVSTTASTTDNGAKPVPAKLDLSEGLLADTANARHDQETFRRDGNPTRPLNPDIAQAKPLTSVVKVAQAATADTAAPAAAPQPVSPSPAAAGGSRLSAGGAMQAPAAAPASPPAAEPQQAAVPPTPPTPPAPPAAHGGHLSSGGVMLTNGTAEEEGGKVSPAPQAKVRSATIQSLDAYKGKSAASFQVADVNFGEGTADLAVAELDRLKGVADLYRQKGGTIRVLGHSSSARIEVNPLKSQEANRHLAQQRAEAVARELVRLGVPTGKVYAGAALDVAKVTPAGGGDATEIYIDY